MNRSSLKRIPGRLAFNGISLYSKKDTTIDTDLVYQHEKVGAAGIGDLDNRDKEAYGEISITADGRMTPAIAAVLWPYANAVQGTGVFSDTDVPCVVHGNDNSLDTHKTAGVVQMPQMIFHPVKTLVGLMKLLALRGNGLNWSAANSLRTFADTGGTFVDATMTTAGIITQDYNLTWGAVSGWAGLNFYDGLVFEPKIEFVDDNPATHGLFNKRIKSVGGILRGIPVGITRQQIDTQLKIQGTGAVRGASGAAKAFTATVTGADGKVYLTLPLGQLIKSKVQNGIEQLREGEVAWEALPVLTAGVRGAYFTTPIA
jgi:hypothetical protein